LSSCILLLPLCSTAHLNPSPHTKTIEAVLLHLGHRSAVSEREQVSEELLDKSDAVFLEMVSEDDLVYFKMLRSRSQKPVLIYGTKVPTSLQIKSLSIGADAFLRLPDSRDILEAKVHAFLRRSGLESFRRSAS